MRNDDATRVFKAIAPAGFFVALRVGFAYPTEVRNEFPKPWVDRYTERGLMLHDPVMHWVYGNVGHARWSQMNLDDPHKILKQASRFGLKYGVAISFAEDGPAGQRSFGTFARKDREFLDAEIGELAEVLKRLHLERTPPTSLTRAELDALRLVKDGHLMKEIANLLGVSEGAVKQRLRKAKSKLNAKTSTHAATMATSYRLI